MARNLLIFKDLNPSLSRKICRQRYIEPYSISKQLSEYMKLGDVRNAEKLFDETPHTDIFAWSIMIHGYAKNKLHRQSMELFGCMRQSTIITPNSFTLVGVITATIGLGDLTLVECVHGMVFKHGLNSNSVVTTALLDAYAKCSDVNGSLKLFEQMDSRGLISCNALLAGLVHNNLSEQAVKLFIELIMRRGGGIVPSSSTVSSLIQGCISLEWWNLCRCVHSLVMKLGLDLEKQNHANNSCLAMYSSMRDLHSAEKIFQAMEGKDVASYSTMMGLLNDLEYASKAVTLFKQMRCHGNERMKFDSVNIIDLITSCSILGDLVQGKEVHAQATVHGYGSELAVVNSLIAMYAKCGELHWSRAIFDGIEKKNIVSWSAIISGSGYGNPREAMKLLVEFQAKERLSLDLVMVVSGLKACGELAVLDVCLQLHGFAIRSGYYQNRTVINSLISTYSKCGDVKLSLKVFEEISSSDDGGYVNVVSWNAMLHGLGINGYGREALNMFEQMLMSGQQEPDETTFLCILSACSHSGMVEEGLGVFSNMVEEEKVKPSEEHFGTVMDLLARAGKLSYSNEFLSGFLGVKGCKALLNGCLIYGNTDEQVPDAAMVALVGAAAADTDSTADQIVLLSNILALAGRFQDAEILRSTIHQKRLMKNIGISQLLLT